MKATVSGIAGRSELATGEACGKSMRALVQFLGSVVLAGLPGCLSFGFGGGDDSDTKASKNVAENAIYREVAEMVKLYRICLQKNEDNPVKAKRTAACTKRPFGTWPLTI